MIVDRSCQWQRQDRNRKGYDGSETECMYCRWRHDHAGTDIACDISPPAIGSGGRYQRVRAQQRSVEDTG